MGKTRAVTYARPYKALPRAEMDADKWGSLYKMLQEAQGKADVLLVHAPEVLGDTYEELVANLSAIASHGLHLVIVPPEDAGFRVINRLPETW